MRYWWTIIGTISSVIATVAAIIAAYYSYLSRPKKVNEVDINVEEVGLLEDNNSCPIC